MINISMYECYKPSNVCCADAILSASRSRCDMFDDKRRLESGPSVYRLNTDSPLPK